MSFIIAILISAATPNAGNAPNGTDATQTKPVKAKKVCRAGASTGSRLPSKICKTQSEWDAQQGADAGRVKRDIGA
jgi:hypothetical protein